MAKPLLDQWHDTRHVLIGMLHLPPLPGAPRYTGELSSVKRLALQDAARLVEGGVHGLLLENFGDAPFYPRRVPTHTVTWMTVIARDIRECFPEIPLGINVLRNDSLSALAVAHAVQAQFIRVNLLCGARVTDQGVLQGTAHQLLRLRMNLDATHIKILADVNVKHSAPLVERPLVDEVNELMERGGADALIVSGTATGRATEVAELRSVQGVASELPVLVGSGVTGDNVQDYLPYAAGFIVGTALKCGREVHQHVDAAAVRQLVARIRGSH